MSTKKMDKAKPHGIVYNDPQGRVYEQDGMFFNGDGTLWVDPAAPKGSKTASTPAPSPAPATGTPDQLSQQMGE